VRGGQTLALSIKVPIAVSHDSKDGNYYSNNETDSEQVVRMAQGNSGYSPNNFTITLGKPVKWIINSTAPYTCSSSILMPAYGINKSLTSGENIITFTPTAAGTIPFSCSMGMYRGSFTVVAGGDAKNNVKNIVPAWGANN
jgi:plastocyanin domain-containing protein